MNGTLTKLLSKSMAGSTICGSSLIPKPALCWGFIFHPIGHRLKRSRCCTQHLPCPAGLPPSFPTATALTSNLLSLLEPSTSVCNLSGTTYPTTLLRRSTNSSSHGTRPSRAFVPSIRPTTSSPCSCFSSTSSALIPLWGGSRLHKLPDFRSLPPKNVSIILSLEDILCLRPVVFHFNFTEP